MKLWAVHDFIENPCALFFTRLSERSAHGSKRLAKAPHYLTVE